MTRTVRDLRTGALAGVLLALPFLVLEALRGGVAAVARALPLWALLWLLPAALVALGLPLFRAARAGERLAARPLQTALRLAGLLAIAAAWILVISDQWPCFLGAANCD